MKISWQENAFRITGPLEWNSPMIQKTSDVEIWSFICSYSEQTDANSRVADDLRRLDASVTSLQRADDNLNRIVFNG